MTKKPATARYTLTEIKRRIAQGKDRTRADAPEGPREGSAGAVAVGFGVISSKETAAQEAYEAIVIGTGFGGTIATIALSAHSKKTLVIERSTFWVTPERMGTPSSPSATRVVPSAPTTIRWANPMRRFSAKGSTQMRRSRECFREALKNADAARYIERVIGPGASNRADLPTSASSLQTKPRSEPRS
jgi:hypothetical protein